MKLKEHRAAEGAFLYSPVKPTGSNGASQQNRARERYENLMCGHHTDGITDKLNQNELGM